jgi:hypothetical protein
VRRALGLAVLVGGPLLYLRRRRHEQRDRVDLYFHDGSTVTLHEGAPHSADLLAAARRAL